MASAADLNELAMALEGTVSAPHFDRTAFKVARTYATLAADGLTANLKLLADEQELKCLTAPEAFQPVPNAWGSQGWTTVTLAAGPARSEPQMAALERALAAAQAAQAESQKQIAELRARLRALETRPASPDAGARFEEISSRLLELESSRDEASRSLPDWLRRAGLWRSLAVAAGGAALLTAAATAAPGSPEPAVPAAAPTLRLISQSQYRNTISSVFGPDIAAKVRFAPVKRTFGLVAVGASRAVVIASLAV